MATDIHVGDTPPPSPAIGDAWFDTISGQLFIWAGDGSSTQWVIAVNQVKDIVGPAGPASTVPGPPGARGPTGPVGAPGSEYFHTANDITRLFDNVQLLVPSLTTDVASLCIWAAVEDFYVRSTYRREHTYWSMGPGVNVVDFDPWDYDWRVCRFMGFRGLSNVRFQPPGKIWDLSDPIPDNTRSGEVLLALKPDTLDTDLGYDVMTTYWETLLSGALYRIHMQPGKPYSDLNAAQLHMKINRSGIASARADVQAGYVREGSSWSFPYFASGHAG